MNARTKRIVLETIDSIHQFQVSPGSVLIATTVRGQESAPPTVVARAGRETGDCLRAAGKRAGVPESDIFAIAERIRVQLK